MDLTECPFLADAEGRRLCGASSHKMVPSDLAFENYCSTEDHYRCPMMLAQLLAAGRKASSYLTNKQRSV
ncbi:MAG: hypothetical protein IME96_02645 [Proteobacteria bacterium]|nr:hypothetical protein [Pseudomonadota bacterium]